MAPTGGITIHADPDDRILLADDGAARALGAAAARLQRRFRDETDPAVIELLLTERYGELARQARITQYLPLLAERSVRRELLSGPGGHDG